MSDHPPSERPGAHASDRPAFPLPALVGADELVTALVLCAVDPAIGGVLLRGEKGSAKTTAARGLAAVLPGDAPFVELPLGATEDRVVGALDLRAALARGEHRFRPGLLAAAHGGVLYVDEVNLLADHLVDVLLDTAVSGVNRVERDGVSHAHPARFVLVGSMNPEEGELRPQLLDRFGLSVTVTTPAGPARAEAVRRRLDFDRHPEAFRARWRPAEEALAERLRVARPAPLADGLEERVAELCAAAGAEGLRADLVICRAAAALAGWEGRSVAGEEEVRRVAALALGHRRRTPFGEQPGGREAVEEALDRAFEEHRAGDQTDSQGGPEPDGGPGGAAHTGAGRDTSYPPGSGEPDPRPGDRESPVEPPPAPGEAAGEAPATRTTGLLDPAGKSEPGRSGGPGRRGRGAPAPAASGPVVGWRVPTGGEETGPLSATGTVLAAAGRRAGAGARAAGGLVPDEEDLRHAVHRPPVANLVVLAVDASGSMGVERRLRAARSAVLSLLLDAYQRRDRVALVVFRGEGAEVALRPTASTEVARARLEHLPRGGRTPLASGLAEGRRLAVAGRRSGLRPLLVVVSDGRATWAGDGQDPLAAARLQAAEVRRAGIEAVVVDCEEGATPLGLAAELAAAMGGRMVAAGDLDGERLAGEVRAVLRARPAGDGDDDGELPPG